MPGYRVMHLIFRTEIDKFFVQLTNVNSANPSEVVTAQILYKAAAQFYEGVTERINEEVLQYTAAPRYGETPKDNTENILDIGDTTDEYLKDITDRFEYVPNLFEETDIL
jgi:hypothetical protein